MVRLNRLESRIGVRVLVPELRNKNIGTTDCSVGRQSDRWVIVLKIKVEVVTLAVSTRVGEHRLAKLRLALVDKSGF